MRILITGAGGLVGSHLLPILEKEHELFTVSSKAAGAHNLYIDFSKDWSPDQLPANLDAIIHLAQSEEFRDFPGKARNVFGVNTKSTIDLADYAVKTGVKKFIYASSGGVYGNGDHVFGEDQPLVFQKEMGFYIATKMCSEIILDNYSSLLDVQQLRFFFVYGKGQRKDMLIPRLVNNVRAGNPVTLSGKEGIRINPLHAGDAARAIQKALYLSGSHTINAGGTEVLSLRQICECIGTAVGAEPVFKTDDTYPRNLVGDIGRMKTLLGDPEIRFSEGIKTLL